MMTKRFFAVRYRWQGETLTHSRTFTNHAEAEALAQEMRADRWQAWVEPRFRA